MEQRERFIRDHQSALYTMADLSARYGMSRKTGYKWGVCSRRTPRVVEGGMSRRNAQ